MAYRPFFMFPAIAIGLGLAIVFFKVYGRVTRPDVPLPVSAAIDHYAPGFAIGKSAKESAVGLAGMRWVPKVGYVGTLKSSAQFTQARLYPGAETRAKPGGDQDAPIQMIELVSLQSGAIAQTMLDLGIAFRSSPRDGCITPPTDSAPYRRVQYWTTRSDRGGVALITEWTVYRPQPRVPVVIWSLLGWSGPFRGSSTLLAEFDARSCLEITGTP